MKREMWGEEGGVGDEEGDVGGMKREMWGGRGRCGG